MFRAILLFVNEEIKKFNTSQIPVNRKICDTLFQVIDKNLNATENKIWHAHPVWFIEGNPIVGYSKLKDCIRLMFWSGQSFKTHGLEPGGSFKAAEVRYTDADQIDEKLLKKWLKESETIQWDYKNIIKRKGELERLE